jgi:hypothetical protein
MFFINSGVVVSTIILFLPIANLSTIEFNYNKALSLLNLDRFLKSNQ